MDVSDGVSNMSFIGGTNFRLIQEIDHFSEDLDFYSYNVK